MTALGAQAASGTVESASPQAAVQNVLDAITSSLADVLGHSLLQPLHAITAYTPSSVDKVPLATDIQQTWRGQPLHAACWPSYARSPWLTALWLKYSQVCAMIANSHSKWLARAAISCIETCTHHFVRALNPLGCSNACFLTAHLRPHPTILV